MLALSANLPGRALPIWKVNVDEGHLLRHIVLHWARTHEVLDRWDLDLPTGVWATGGVGGPDLDFDSSIRSLSPLLPIQYARQTVTINWPAPEKPSGAGSGNGAHRSGKARLNKLRISTRYAGVDGATAGFHRSSTMQAKIDAGEYQDTAGKFCQSSFIEAMRTPPEPSSSSSSGCAVVQLAREPLETRVLHVVSGKAKGLPEKELFRAACNYHQS